MLLLWCQKIRQAQGVLLETEMGEVKEASLEKLVQLHPLRRKLLQSTGVLDY